MFLEKLALIVGGKINNLLPEVYSSLKIYENVKMVDAIDLAKELEKNGTKAIITTIGTAAAIEGAVSIPIIRAIHTLFDVLETVIDFETQTGLINKNLFLIVHCSKQIDIERLNKFTQNSVNIHYYKDLRDIRKTIELLQVSPDNVIVGGASSLYYADEKGLPSWPLTFGWETLSVAIDKARSVIQAIRHTKEAASKLKTVLNLLSSGILVTDSNGTIIDYNTQALSYLELSADKVLGNKIEKVVGDNTWVTSYVNGISTLGQIRKFKHKTYFVSDYPIALADGRIIGSVANFHGVAEIEKLEKKYRQIQTAGLVAKSRFEHIIGNSPAITNAVEKAKAYAQVDSTILLYGETGVGKELFAQSIHNHSSRKFGPFIAINCAALPENLLESELMGYEEGAFTGARKGGKTGLIELAHKGTLFLDEINHMPPSIQARMLRVVQEKQVMRLGGERIIPVDVRILTATNAHLKTLVKENKFREDLFYRLNVLELKIPALRERREDISVLLKHLVALHTVKYGSCQAFTDISIEKLEDYDWPGNIRELYNFAERYVVLSKNNLTTQEEFVDEYTTDNYIPLTVSSDNLSSSQASIKTISKDEIILKIDTLKNMEKVIIDKVLQIHNGSRNKTASTLGISRASIWKKTCIKDLENH